jgi:hypothetical protein
MRVESSVLSLSWIPSEAIPAGMRLPFDHGVTHYDEPLPEVVDDLADLLSADRFRFGNELRGWIEVEDGRITDFGQGGQGHMGSTTVRLRVRDITFPGVSLPDLQPPPEVGPTWVRFRQTTGGRTGLPAPRPVPHPPFVQLAAPIVWTTLALTVHTDGRVERDLIGASPFPRHWIYDDSGRIVAKSGLLQFGDWFASAFGARTPWGEADSPAVISAVETALERQLSRDIMRGKAKPEFRTLSPGATLVQQGSRGTEVFLLLDGIVEVEVDGEVLAEIGPGAVLGERAILEGGVRTSTLRARTKVRIAVVAGDVIDLEALRELSGGHRREEI